MKEKIDGISFVWGKERLVTRTLVKHGTRRNAIDDGYITTFRVGVPPGSEPVSVTVKAGDLALDLRWGNGVRGNLSRVSVECYIRRSTIVIKHPNPSTQFDVSVLYKASYADAKLNEVVTRGVHLTLQNGGLHWGETKLALDEPKPPVLYDGLTAAQCLERYERRQRTDNPFQLPPGENLTLAQLSAARAEWAVQLRIKRQAAERDAAAAETTVRYCEVEPWE